jgi:hypothetical protein
LAERGPPQIRLVSSLETSIYRFYFDEEDAQMVQYLKDKGWITGASTRPQAGG